MTHANHLRTQPCCAWRVVTVPRQMLAHTDETLHRTTLFKMTAMLNQNACCTKVIMSGVNGNVIMSGCRDDNPDDERREAARDNTKSVSRGADGGGGRDGDR